MSVFLCVGLAAFYGSRIAMALRYGHSRIVIHGMVKSMHACLIAALDGAWLGVLVFQAHCYQPRAGPLTALGLLVFTSGVLLSLWGRWHLGANWRTAADAGIVPGAPADYGRAVRLGSQPNLFGNTSNLCWPPNDCRALDFSVARLDPTATANRSRGAGPRSAFFGIRRILRSRPARFVNLLACRYVIQSVLLSKIRLFSYSMRVTIFFLLCLITGLHILGLQGLYYSMNLYDNLVHFLGGVTSALLLFEFWSITRKQVLSFVGLLIGMALISFFWELYEFGWDQLLVAQHGLPIQQLGVGDTLTDVITNFLGAMIAFAIVVKKRVSFLR